MQILVGLEVSKHNHITIVDRLPLVSVLVSRLNHKTDLFVALRYQADQVARFVNLRTIFGSFDEVLAIVMQQLELITVCDSLTASPIQSFLILGGLLVELFVKIAHLNFVRLGYSGLCAWVSRTRSFIEVLFEGCVLLKRVVVHLGHNQENEVAHVSLVCL